jgi:hypothetical protein
MAQIMQPDPDRERKMREEVAQVLEPDLAQQQEWLGQTNLIYGGLITVGVLMVQPFLTAPSLDLAATICVIAFAVAIPLLAALVLVNREETFRGRRTPSRLVAVGNGVGQSAAFVGIVAAFWHINWVAGVAILVSSFVAMGVHSAGWVRLALPDLAAAQSGEGESETG